MKRLGVVVVLAVAAFAAALVAFADPGRRGCVFDAPRDRSYSVRFVDEVVTTEIQHVLAVTREGEPVTGAVVCVNIEMVGMTGMGATAQAEELGDGRYRVSIRMPMSGEWRGSVVVKPPGADPVGVPVEFRVTSG